MYKKYKLGIIGFGGMAFSHFKVHREYDTNITVKGVFDFDEHRMEIAVENGLIAYESREELLSDSEIDIVLVTTTNEVHKEICIEALRHGKHVICEKPVTMNSQELVEIMVVAKETGKIFTIDQNRRTNLDFVLMKQNVEAGVIGKPYVIESRVEGSRGMPSGWRTIKRLGGGMMLDWGVHLIDQLMYMIDEKVISVYCKMFHIDYSDVEDNFRLTFTFESGLVAHIEVSTNNYITHPRWYVLGANGTLQIEDWSCKGEVCRCIDKDCKWDEEIVYTEAGPTKTMAPRRPESVEHIQLSRPVDVEDGVQVVYRQFIGAIEGGELTIKPEQALRVLKVMEASFESAEKEITVKTNI